jgi:hypothetical protein
MPGALFALPCQACGSTTDVVVRDTIVCNRCDRSYLVKFGHLIEIVRRDGRIDHEHGPAQRRSSLAPRGRLRT